MDEGNNEYSNISSDNSDVIALLELQQLYQGDVFAYYCKERREVQLTSLHFLPHKSQLCLRRLDSADPNNSNNNNICSPSDHNFANGGLMVVDLPSLMVRGLGGCVRLFLCPSPPVDGE